jgi:hypothetical protein
MVQGSLAGSREIVSLQLQKIHAAARAALIGNADLDVPRAGEPPSASDVECSVVSVVLRTPNGFGLPPVFAKDRPQVLIVSDPVTREGPPEHGFVNGAELLQCAVAPSVVDASPSLETGDADLLKCEINHEPGPLYENPCAPDRGTQDEPPFRCYKIRIEAAHLEQTHRDIRSFRHNGKAGVPPGYPLSLGPRDEPLESLD